MSNKELSKTLQVALCICHITHFISPSEPLPSQPTLLQKKTEAKLKTCSAQQSWSDVSVTQTTLALKLKVCEGHIQQLAVTLYYTIYKKVREII